MNEIRIPIPVKVLKSNRHAFEFYHKGKGWIEVCVHSFVDDSMVENTYYRSMRRAKVDIKTVITEKRL